MAPSVPPHDPDRYFLLQPAPCIGVDFDGRIVRANPAFCDVAGRAEEELRALGLFALVPPERREEVEQAIARAAEQDVVSFDIPIGRPDGAFRWLEFRGVSEPLRRVVRFIAHDATSLRRAESEARERERFLETLLSNLPGMVYRCRNDPQWTLDFVSGGCEAVSGYGVDDLLFNKTTSFGELMHSDDAPKVWDIVQDAIAKKAPFTAQYRISTKSGEEKWCYEQGRGVYSSEGELLALEGFIADVTERVRVEEELRDKLALIEAQREQIADLSLPIIEVWDGVLTLPVVGALDDARAARIMQGLLEAVVRTQSEHVIVDLTAVETVDAAVAEHLVAILRAVGLLGARGVLSGIRPAVAQALVGLSADLGGVPTLPDLRAALRSCLRAAAKDEKPRKRA